MTGCVVFSERGHKVTNDFEADASKLLDDARDLVDGEPLSGRAHANATWERQSLQCDRDTSAIGLIFELIDRIPVPPHVSEPGKVRLCFCDRG